MSIISLSCANSDQLFSFVDKFSESERLHAGKDLQFGELRTLWKEFKAEVEALEQRLTQCVDLESEVWTSLCALKHTHTTRPVERACETKRRVFGILDSATTNSIVKMHV